MTYKQKMPPQVLPTPRAADGKMFNLNIAQNTALSITHTEEKSK